MKHSSPGNMKNQQRLVVVWKCQTWKKRRFGSGFIARGGKPLQLDCLLPEQTEAVVLVGPAASRPLRIQPSMEVKYTKYVVKPLFRKKMSQEALVIALIFELSCRTFKHCRRVSQGVQVTMELGCCYQISVSWRFLYSIWRKHKTRHVIYCFKISLHNVDFSPSH